MQSRVLLLIGSPKPFGSVSEKLGKCLLECFANHGFAIDIEHVGRSIRYNKLDALIEKVNVSDITIIATPLYVDSLPAPLIRFLENYRNDNQKINKRLIGIVNSGFPESFQNDYAIENLRLFATHNGFSWAGGFKIGGGGAFEGVDLEKAKIARNIVESFEKTAEYLARNQEIPDDILEKASISVIPKSIYVIVGQLGWIIQSIKYRTLFKLWSKPYSPGST